MLKRTTILYPAKISFKSGRCNQLRNEEVTEAEVEHDDGGTGVGPMKVELPREASLRGGHHKREPES